ncbi:hypothetical protein CKA32_001757 [Geitlerinema sp. FC II]|nr:hypothetical protein CKA32_001757 [Geitlerinema sp. FC II]
MQEIAEILTGKEFLLNGIKSPLKSRNSFPDIGYKHLPYTPRSEEPKLRCFILSNLCFYKTEMYPFAFYFHLRVFVLPILELLTQTASISLSRSIQH